MKSVNIAVVSAGLSNPSSTALLADQLADEAVRQLQAAGVQASVERVELRALGNDIMQYFLTGIPTPALEGAHRALDAAHGVIAVTPIFKASYSGLFKSFWDTVDEGALANKVVLPAATGGTPRHSLALESSVRPLLGYLKGVVIPSAVFAATADFGSDASLPRRITTSTGEFVNLMLAFGSAGASVPAESDRGRGEGAPAVPGAEVDGALVGESAAFDEAGGANSGSFFGIVKGGSSPTQGDRLVVTDFEQLLNEVQGRN